MKNPLWKLPTVRYKPLWQPFSRPITHGDAYIIHLPRLVFDCFQYANMELEGLGNVVMCCGKMVGGILKALSFLVMSSPRIFTSWYSLLLVHLGLIVRVNVVKHCPLCSVYIVSGIKSHHHTPEEVGHKQSNIRSPPTTRRVNLVEGQGRGSFPPKF